MVITPKEKQKSYSSTTTTETGETTLVGRAINGGITTSGSDPNNPTTARDHSHSRHKNEKRAMLRIASEHSGNPRETSQIISTVPMIDRTFIKR